MNRVRRFIIGLLVIWLSACASLGDQRNVAIQMAQLTIAIEQGYGLSQTMFPGLQEEAMSLLTDPADKRIAKRAQYDLDGFFSYVSRYQGGGAEALLSIADICYWRDRLYGNPKKGIEGGVKPYLDLLVKRSGELSPESAESLNRGIALWEIGDQTSQGVCTADIGGLTADEILQLIRVGMAIVGMFT